MDAVVGIAPFPVEIERPRPERIARPSGNAIGELGIAVWISADHVARWTPGRPFGLALDDRGTPESKSCLADADAVAYRAFGVEDMVQKVAPREYQDLSGGMLLSDADLARLKFVG
jgi:hypothetical protein